MPNFEMLKHFKLGNKEKGIKCRRAISESEIEKFDFKCNLTPWVNPAIKCVFSL